MEIKNAAVEVVRRKENILNWLVEDIFEKENTLNQIFKPYYEKNLLNRLFYEWEQSAPELPGYSFT